MITYDYKKINSLSPTALYKSKINQIKEDINLLKVFSDILEIENIREVENVNESYDILLLIKEYELFIQSNDFHDCKCPRCKKEGTLHYHKTYTRDIIFYIGKYEIIAKIKLSVLECKNCITLDKDAQKYHAIIPNFIFPYHIYSSILILNTFYERFIQKIRIKEIIDKRNITHQLFYKWLRGFKKYSLSASTLLAIKVNIESIIRLIIKDIHSFLWNYYQVYYHPFFLFKNTCVPLSIIP